MLIPGWLILVGVLIFCGGPFLIFALVSGVLVRGVRSQEDKPSNLGLRDR